jgi:hypothetical protein
LPEFDVWIQTVRTGTRALRVLASDAAEARSIADAECRTGECHCLPEWCTDDVESNVAYVRGVVDARHEDRLQGPLFAQIAHNTRSELG